MAQDLLTAIALVLIIEGLGPGLAPVKWLAMMRDLEKLGPRRIRLIGIMAMLAGAVMLQFLR